MRWLFSILRTRVGGLRSFRFLLVAGLLAAGIGATTHPYKLFIEMQGDIPVAATAQVFYSFDGLSYYAENSRVLSRKSAGGGSSFFINVATAEPIKAIRLDPSNESGPFRWTSLTLRGNAGAWQRQGAELDGLARNVEQLRLISVSDVGLQMEATGNDPKMVVDLPQGLTSLTAAQRITVPAAAVGWGVLVAAVLEGLILLFGKQHAFRRRFDLVLNRTAEALSDSAVLRVPSSAIAVYGVLVLLACLWVGAKLHQSSIGIWDGMFPQEHIERSVSIGSPKPIRSDEWGTLTPWILNQALSGMKNNNPNIGAPGSPMLAGAPVLSPVMLAQPKYWGFVFLDVERGFSWYWAYKSFGLVIAFFSLLLLLTKGDTWVSLAGAIGMFGASYIQWWYSSVPSEVISGFAMAVVGSVYLLQARSSAGMAVGAILAALAVPNLLLQLYPPFLLMMGYLAAFLLAALLLNAAARDNFLYRQARRWVFVGLSLLLTGLLVGSWYSQVREAADLMMNTAYPGRRVNLGGDYPWHAIFYGIFESWKIDDSVTPFSPVNPSEASNFWILFPLALILVPWQRWRQSPVLKTVTFLMAYCLLTLAWTSLPLPDAIKSVLAHAGWSLVPASRTQLGFAVASALMFPLLVSATARGELQPVKVPGVLLALLTVLAVGGYGKYLQTMDPLFFTDWRIALGAVVAAALVLAAHGGVRWLYGAVMVAAALPTMYVNPIQNGLEPYLNKRIFQLARQAGSAQQDKWAVYGNMRLAQGFRSVGLQVINGTYYTPRLDMLEKLDPDGQYKDVWNRYAHVELTSVGAGQEPTFEIRYADHYRIIMDVCGPHIRSAGVTHLAFTYVPDARELACLDPLLVNDYSGVNLYRLRALN